MRLSISLVQCGINDGSLCVEVSLVAGDETLKCLTLLLHMEPVIDSEKAFSP